MSQNTVFHWLRTHMKITISAIFRQARELILRTVFKEIYAFAANVHIVSV